MESPNVVDSKSCPYQEGQYYPDITDAYICLFFDGTGNNIYEQQRKNNKFLKQKGIVFSPKSIQYSATPNLFTSYKENKQNAAKTGMLDYEKQLEQAERDYTIGSERSHIKDPYQNGGYKYSNVAILRSLVKKIEPRRDQSTGKVTGIRYSLYIEGSGKLWETGSDFIGLGMGTGRTGVVGLVSKSMVFITDYLESHIPEEQFPNVNLHFAVFGFSRGSTCGRLFSYLATKDPNTLPKKQEFKHYLPNSYWNNDQLLFLNKFNRSKISVDFLGIYDTVSSIGFLLKDDPSTDYGINSFHKIIHEKTKKTRYVNNMHGLLRFTQDQKDARFNYHCDNVTDYGLYSPQNENVKHTFHICALDEYRENFALVDLGSKLNRCCEVFMPGCHSDIGGGYLYNDDIERYTLRRGIDKYRMKLVKNRDPRKQTDVTDDLSEKVLYEQGWLNDLLPDSNRTITSRGDRNSVVKLPTDSIFYKQKIKNLSIDTEGQTVYINQVPAKIEFERHVKEGYSNITLKMMIDRAESQYGFKEIWGNDFFPFNNSANTLPPRFAIPSDIILDSIIRDSNKEFNEGCRHWILPETSESYAELRRRFIHFTCTDELNLEKLHFVASGANLGNPPNWRRMGDHYLLCRILYRGDEGDYDLQFLDEQIYGN